eukprot:jgi/Mesvir1/14972/Mv14635-RA.1
MSTAVRKRLASDVENAASNARHGNGTAEDEEIPRPSLRGAEDNLQLLSQAAAHINGTTDEEIAVPNGVPEPSPRKAEDVKPTITPIPAALPATPTDKSCAGGGIQLVLWQGHIGTVSISELNQESSAMIHVKWLPTGSKRLGKAGESDVITCRRDEVTPRMEWGRHGVELSQEGRIANNFRSGELYCSVSVGLKGTKNKCVFSVGDMCHFDQREVLASLGMLYADDITARTSFILLAICNIAQRRKGPQRFAFLVNTMDEHRRTISDAPPVWVAPRLVSPSQAVFSCALVAEALTAPKTVAVLVTPPSVAELRLQCGTSIPWVSIPMSNRHGRDDSEYHDDVEDGEYESGGDYGAPDYAPDENPHHQHSQQGLHPSHTHRHDRPPPPAPYYLPEYRPRDHPGYPQGGGGSGRYLDDGPPLKRPAMRVIREDRDGESFPAPAGGGGGGSGGGAGGMMVAGGGGGGGGGSGGVSNHTRMLERRLTNAEAEILQLRKEMQQMSRIHKQLQAALLKDQKTHRGANEALAPSAPIPPPRPRPPSPWPHPPPPLSPSYRGAPGGRLRRRHRWHHPPRQHSPHSNQPQAVPARRRPCMHWKGRPLVGKRTESRCPAKP